MYLSLIDNLTYLPRIFSTYIINYFWVTENKNAWNLESTTWKDY